MADSTSALVWHQPPYPIKVELTYLDTGTSRLKGTYTYNVLAYAVKDRDLVYMTAQGFYIDLAWYRKQDDRYVKVVVE